MGLAKLYIYIVASWVEQIGAVGERIGASVSVTGFGLTPKAVTRREKKEKLEIVVDEI